MSPAHARTSRAAIITAARELLEAGGIEAVSMAAVAARVGIRAPSLYKHVTDRSTLLAEVATDVALALERTLTDAVGRAGADPVARLEALALGYRSFALATPRSAALLFAGVAPDVEPSPASQAAAARPVLEVAASLVGPERALAVARVLTAFAYGFTSMEAAGAFRFGGDVEAAYRVGIRVLAGGLAGLGSDTGPARRR